MADEGKRTRRITFPGAAQGVQLSARLGLPNPDTEVQGYALLAHCFTCSKDLKPLVHLNDVLTEAGVGVLRFDFTGLGESEGDFAETSFSSNIDDLAAAAHYLEAEHDAPSLLVGHSLGGAAVLQAAARLPSVKAVATLGAPFEPGHVRHLFQDSLDEIEERGEATVELAGRRFTVSRDFVRDLEEHHMETVISELKRPLLVFHSPVDRTVGIENAARIYEAARHPKSFVSLDDADHLLLNPRDARFAGGVLAAWADRYL